jgi:hypothetical protein
VPQIERRLYCKLCFLLHQHQKRLLRRYHHHLRHHYHLPGLTWQRFVQQYHWLNRRSLLLRQPVKEAVVVCSLLMLHLLHLLLMLRFRQCHHYQNDQLQESQKTS